MAEEKDGIYETSVKYDDDSYDVNSLIYSSSSSSSSSFTLPSSSYEDEIDSTSSNNESMSITAIELSGGNTNLAEHRLHSHYA